MYGGARAEARKPKTPTTLDLYPLDPDRRSTFALEVRAAPGPGSLLRVLNPLQKLDVTPISVRAGEGYSATGQAAFVIEIMFDASRAQADKVRRNIAACVLVHEVDLMRCAR